jgi:hypothetical protein
MARLSDEEIGLTENDFELGKAIEAVERSHGE